MVLSADHKLDSMATASKARVIKIFTLATDSGRYNSTVIPIGLCTAPAIFE